MRAHRSILAAACLSLAACSGFRSHDSARDVAVSGSQVTVHVVEASGGA